MTAAYIERAHREYFIALAILFYYPLAVHKPETAALVLAKFACGIAYERGIIHLFVEYAFDVGLRKPYAAVGNRQLHITVALGSLHGYGTTRRGKLTRVIYEGIYHKKCEGAVGLHHGIAHLNIERYAARIKELPAFGNDIKQFAHRKALYLQVQIAATHFYPALQNCIIVVEFFCELGNILKATFDSLHPLATRQVAQFVEHTVHIWAHTAKHRHRHTLEQILALVLSKV